MGLTIGGAIRRLDRVAPNEFGDEEKIGWLSALDGRIRAELLDGRRGAGGDGFQGYGPESDLRTPLLVQDAYGDIYVKWMMAQMDLLHGEAQRYNASMAAFNRAWMELAGWVNRTYRPAQGAGIARTV